MKNFTNLNTSELLTHLEFPKRIICMTEESVETLFALGKGHLIVGVSAYVERPMEALKIPKISVFTHANIKKITELHPDLILGFSDIQKEIAKDLIGEGHHVYIANHRSIIEIFQYILFLGSMVGARKEAKSFCRNLQQQLKNISEQAKLLNRKPKIYFEEWDHPMITGIRWVSELIEICGGIDINQSYSCESLAKNRIIASPEEIIEKNPDIILACWCGKKVDQESIAKRPGWDKINAVKNNQIFELDPAIFLQPGPAPLLDGSQQLLSLFQQWNLNA